MRLRFGKALGIGLAILVPSLAVAALDIPTQFNAGDPLSSADMNGNFDAVKAAFDALEARVEELESKKVRSYEAYYGTGDPNVTDPIVREEPGLADCQIIALEVQTPTGVPGTLHVFAEATVRMHHVPDWRETIRASITTEVGEGCLGSITSTTNQSTPLGTGDSFVWTFVRAHRHYQLDGTTTNRTLLFNVVRTAWSDTTDVGYSRAALRAIFVPD